MGNTEDVARSEGQKTMFACSVSGGEDVTEDGEGKQPFLVTESRPLLVGEVEERRATRPNVSEHSVPPE